jgi:hypothetical protein
MTAINANVSADQEWLPLSEDDSLSLISGYYTIDSENVKVENGPHPASSVSNPIPKYNGRRAQRGVGGSTPASHTSGATLTRYYPEAPGGTGSGGVTVDNTVDPPAAVTSMTVPGAVLAGADADLTSVVTIRQATAVLTDAQVKALPTTPVELVAAPGPGSVLSQIGAIGILDSTAGAYTNLVGRIEVGNDDGAAFTTGWNASGFLNDGVQIRSSNGPFGAFVDGAGLYQVSLADVEDTNLALHAVGASGAFTGGHAANTLRLTVWYAIVNLT